MSLKHQDFIESFNDVMTKHSNGFRVHYEGCEIVEFYIDELKGADGPSLMYSIRTVESPCCKDILFQDYFEEDLEVREREYIEEYEPHNSPFSFGETFEYKLAKAEEVITNAIKTLELSQPLDVSGVATGALEILRGYSSDD